MRREREEKGRERKRERESESMGDERERAWGKRVRESERGRGRGRVKGFPHSSSGLSAACAGVTGTQVTSSIKQHILNDFTHHCCNTSQALTDPKRATFKRPLTHTHHYSNTHTNKTT